MTSNIYYGFLYDFVADRSDIWTCKVDPVTYIGLSSTCRKIVRKCNKTNHIMLKIKMGITPPQFLYAFKPSKHCFEYVELPTVDLFETLRGILIRLFKLTLAAQRDFLMWLNTAWDVLETTNFRVPVHKLDQLRTLDDKYKNGKSFLIQLNLMIKQCKDVDQAVEIIKSVDNVAVSQISSVAEHVLEIRQLIDSF